MREQSYSLLTIKLFNKLKKATNAHLVPPPRLIILRTFSSLLPVIPATKIYTQCHRNYELNTMFWAAAYKFSY